MGKNAAVVLHHERHAMLLKPAESIVVIKLMEEIAKQTMAARIDIGKARHLLERIGAIALLSTCRLRSKMVTSICGNISLRLTARKNPAAPPPTMAVLIMPQAI